MNQTKKEFTALQHLSKRRDIIIKKVDKGNCIVVEDTETYIANGENHLSDKRTYTRRYIDDIFMIWTHGRDSLETFLRENTFHHSIKFTLTSTQKQYS